MTDADAKFLEEHQLTEDGPCIIANPWPFEKDLSTSEGTSALLSYILHVAKDHLANDGYIVPAAFLSVRKHPEDERPLDCPIVLPVLIDTSDDEMIYLSLDCLKKLAACYDAVGSILISEAWSADAVQVLASGAWASENSNRREIVVAVVEHRTFGVKVWSAEILRHSDVPSLGPLTESPGVAGGLIGVLSGR